MRMRIRVPKPLHGWREFIGEVGIIVLGVIIAIGLGQLVEAMQWRSEVDSATAALGDDIARSNRAFAFRVAAHDCIAGRIATLNEIIERVARREPVPLVGKVIPDIGNGLPNNAWETSRAAQLLPHFNRDALRLYGAYFLQVGNVQAFMGREVEDWGVLRILEGNPARLGPIDVSGMRVAIEHASFENDLIADIAGEELATSRNLGIKAPQADPRRLAEVCNPLERRP
jgi:hypothetical protein